MDTLGNLATQIRNGYLAGKTTIVVPASKLSEAVGRVLVSEGYLANIERSTTETGRPILTVSLRYQEKLPAVEKIRRISTPGRRVYSRASAIPRPRTGIGTTIVSTPAGILSAKEAQKQRQGGELLLEVVGGGGR